MANKIVEETEQLLQPILEELNLELVEVLYEKEGKNWFLRIYIDKAGGVDIEECGTVSERLSEKLDEIDPITGAYFLEVSSPGVERPLKKPEDFKAHVGDNIFVKLYQPIDNEKEFNGKLLSFKEDLVEIEYKVKTRKKTLEIPYKLIAKANLSVSFD
ncbi:ribosome maturation factor RimP [Saliterribacillus persicus]|uniref:Ribosome maturation factor RimP n=1 Tax=Saliterribacillus persicus TaxID=930114 RepID=A0A368XUG2_9BACI|nr:ribosome maturation factor RimP [Saliterribacillus persicus]RCW70678.1 ribosome maturation factor RimP [Saliterribacillus persicus]